ncbi:MAG: 30S ribosomal protein S5 [Enterobacteriaceae bacterium]
MNKKSNDIFLEKLISVNRVSKTVKGGRVFGFTALTVVGNTNGKIGIGYSKSKEVPVAIQKSINKAKKSLINILTKNSTIQHEVIGYHTGSKVFIKPACKGTGIIAGGAMRAMFEVLGIRDVLAKIYGSSNPINVVYATMNALHKIRSISFVASKRGKFIKEIFSI